MSKDDENHSREKQVNKVQVSENKEKLQSQQYKASRDRRNFLERKLRFDHNKTEEKTEVNGQNIGKNVKTGLESIVSGNFCKNEDFYGGLQKDKSNREKPMCSHFCKYQYLADQRQKQVTYDQNRDTHRILKGFQLFGA